MHGSSGKIVIFSRELPLKRGIVEQYSSIVNDSEMDMVTLLIHGYPLEELICVDKMEQQ